MQKNVLVIAGGQWQAPLIKFLKQNGYTVYVVDPYETSGGVQYADHQLKADVRDKETISELIKGIDFEFITTDQSDISVGTVAYFSQKLGLPGNDPLVVEQFSNKFLSRKYASSLGLPVPAFKEVTHPGEIAVFCKEHNRPVILKPVDSQGSRGIHKITDADTEDLAALFEDAIATSKKKTAIIEEFLNGIEVTVEGLCSNYRHRSIAYSSKTHFRTGVASTIEYPAKIPAHLVEQVLEANDKYVNHSGLKFGITHAEYIVDVENETFGLVEIACRGGGALISSDLAKWVSGIDTYEFLLTNLEGGIVDMDRLQPLKRNAIIYFLEFPAGVVKSIEGAEKIRELEGVHDLRLFFKPGDVLKPASDDGSRQGQIIIFAGSKKELDERVQEVKNTLKVTVEQLAVVGNSE